MTGVTGDETFRPGEKVPASGIYECDSGCGHRWSTDVEGHRFPPLPGDCKGGAWRLAARAPVGSGEGGGHGEGGEDDTVQDVPQGGRPGMTPVDRPYGGRADVPEGVERPPGEWESHEVHEQRRERPRGPV